MKKRIGTKMQLILFSRNGVLTGLYIFEVMICIRILTLHRYHLPAVTSGIGHATLPGHIGHVAHWISFRSFKHRAFAVPIRYSWIYGESREVQRKSRIHRLWNPPTGGHRSYTAFSGTRPEFARSSAERMPIHLSLLVLTLRTTSIQAAGRTKRRGSNQPPQPARKSQKCNLQTRS